MPLSHPPTTGVPKTMASSTDMPNDSSSEVLSLAARGTKCEFISPPNVTDGTHLNPQRLLIVYFLLL